MMKYLKNNKGFTLVEVIVVAVIVLILAAVAIPLYNGYIRDSRQGTCENVAGSVASLLGAAVQTNSDITTSTPAGGSPLVSVKGGGFGDSSQVIIPVGYSVASSGGIVTATYVGTYDDYDKGDIVATVTFGPAQGTAYNFGALKNTRTKS